MDKQQPKSESMRRAYFPLARRIAFGAVLVAAGVYLAQGFYRLFAEWRQATQPVAARRMSAADFNSMAAVLPLAGQWSFAELDWNLRSHVVKRSDADARFETLGVTPVSQHAAQLPDVSQELYDYVAKLRIEPFERAGNQVYLLDKPNLKAELVVRNVAGKMKTVALAIGFPKGADEWQVFELTPRQSAGTPDLQTAHLLPLPTGAQRSGGRFADDGTVLLELITLESSADVLLAQWKNSGWEVRPSGLGGPGGFSYLCARGNEVVYAWSANPRDSLENLMLVRTPDASDTGAE